VERDMAKIPQAWNLNIDFIGRINAILISSVIMCTASFASLATRGLNFGTDFAGGYEMQVHFPKSVSETQIREILAPMALQDARVQSYGDANDNEYLVLVRGGSNGVSAATRDAVRSAMQKLAGGADHVTNLSLAESGENLVVGFDTATDGSALRTALTQLGLKVKKISQNERSDRPEFAVDLYSLSDDIANTLQKALGLPADAEIVKRMDFVGPQVGAELRNQGVLAVVYSLLLILIYVGIRFDMFFAPGAIVATLHDIIITMGVFSFFQFEFNLTVVAAILTLIGWSLNDTIVVYDRIRENVVRLRGKELRAMVNSSINETMSRTILTSGTVFLVVAALLFLGGPHIQGFSITMFVGVIVGTYSSIAVASPIYILLRENADRRQRRAHTQLSKA
jgi:preprotein translocase subunit SecF